MLFLGLGTGLGSTLIVDGIVEPMALGHLPYRDRSFEEHVGLHGLQTRGLMRWRRDVEDVVNRLIARSSPRTSFSAAATSTNWTRCRLVAEPATTRTRLLGGFDCGSNWTISRPHLKK